MDEAITAKVADTQHAMTIQELPTDTILTILALSSGRTVARAAQVCSVLRHVAESPQLWLILCDRAGLCTASPAVCASRVAATALPRPLPYLHCRGGVPDWRGRYIACATCDHSDRPQRQLDWWRSGNAALSGVYLDPGRGAIRTGCACAACGREFEVVAKAEYDAADDAFGRCTEEFGAVRTKLRFRARRLSGDEVMDQQWDEERATDFCFYTSE